MIAVVFAGVTILGVKLYVETDTAQKLQPMSVAYTKVDIPPHTLITKEMIMVMPNTPGSAVPPNALTRPEDIIGKWTVPGYGLSKNSLIYKDKILPTDEMPDASILKLKEGEYAFPLLVDIETSSGNSILPDTYVDLWFTSDQRANVDKPIVGNMFSKVRVTTVKDNNTQNVFDAQDYTQAPNQGQQQGGIVSQGNSGNGGEKPAPKLAKLYTFAVTADQLKYLNKAKLKGKVFPVAFGSSQEDIKKNLNITTTGELNGDKEILAWIDNQTFQFASAKQEPAKPEVKEQKEKTNNQVEG